MKTNLEKISGVKRKLTVEVEAEEVGKRVNEAYKTIGKRAKIPGFRPGKIPRKILERYFSAQVAEDVTRSLVSETLPQAVEETQSFPLTTPLVENEELRVGQDFKYAAVMEVKPAIQLKPYKALDVEKEIVSVTDEAVAKELEEIRKATGQLKPAEAGRGLQEGDYAVIEYEGFDGGAPLEGVKAKDFTVKVGSREFQPEIEKALLGRKIGERIEIGVDFGPDETNSRAAGKKVDFKVEVKDIKVMELPELNDDFAKSLGAEFNDLETLKKRIKEDLVAREEKRADGEVKKRLLKKISDVVEFELPECLVDAEVRYGIEGLKRNLVRMGSNLAKAGLNEEKLREEMRPAAEKRVKDLLILGEIAKENDLAVSETDLSDGYREMGEKFGQDPQVLRQYYEANQLVDSLRERLLEEKTLNYLVQTANIHKQESSHIDHGQSSIPPAGENDESAS